jgi:hypothetical protein
MQKLELVVTMESGYMLDLRLCLFNRIVYAINKMRNATWRGLSIWLWRVDPRVPVRSCD